MCKWQMKFTSSMVNHRKIKSPSRQELICPSPTVKWDYKAYCWEYCIKHIKWMNFSNSLLYP